MFFSFESYDKTCTIDKSIPIYIGRYLGTKYTYYIL